MGVLNLISIIYNRMRTAILNGHKLSSYIIISTIFHDMLLKLFVLF